MANPFIGLARLLVKLIVEYLIKDQVLKHHDL